MIADITITEKSFGSKSLMQNVRFTINDGEKIGIIGRNGVGKSTLFGILSGTDKDYTGDVIYRTGVTVVATQQEHHGVGETTVLQYVLQGLPEYSKLSHVIETYPETMGDNMKMINEYSEALQRFTDKGFYQIEEQIERELDNFQLSGIAHRQFSTLSGGQKRLVEVVKIMHSDAHLALIDEPTNHMDYIAKQQFIDWMKDAREAVLVITHDRDVLREVDRVIELKDGVCASYTGNYDAYLKQNAVSTGSQMNEYEVTQRKIENLKKRVQYARSKKASWGGTADKRNPFVVMEQKALREIKELEKIEKPTFWIDKESAADLNHKTSVQYEKFKAKNVRINLKSDSSRSKHVLVEARELSLGYDTPLFGGLNIDLREGEAVEFRGRNGAGKTTLIKAILQAAQTRVTDGGAAPAFVNISDVAKVGADRLAGPASSDLREPANDGSGHKMNHFDGELIVDKQVRVGVYEQEVSPTYFSLPLEEAIEKMHMDRGLDISTTKIRSLMSDYLFTEGDGKVPIERLSGGQKARFQLITMLANDPQLLILDEPTNHLDLPSIEEMETALARYSGAIIYVSHDNYFRDKIGGEVVQIGTA